MADLWCRDNATERTYTYLPTDGAEKTKNNIRV